MNFLAPEAWDLFVEQHPQAHILQTSSWGGLKAKFGWSPKFIRHGDLGAMVLFRPLPLGLSVAYIPRGPVGQQSWEVFWPVIDALCHEEGVVFLRVEPQTWEPVAESFIESNLPGFNPTDQTIQPPHTILIDLQQTEEDILMGMKSKTRYNIRLAERKEVVVKQSSDVESFHRMMLTTGERDEFGIHTLAYYRAAYDEFAPKGKCVLLVATYQDEPLAGLMAFAHGDTAWYFYGASTNQERNRMPTYLLQWEAICWAKTKGCKTYDLWGIPDFPEDKLEAAFTDRSDGLWGVYRFKRGFGGELKRTIGAYDRVYRPLLYRLYQLYSSRYRTPAA